MAGSLGDFLELKLLDLAFGGVAYSFPANLYVAAFTVAPTDAGGGTEVTGGSYARVTVVRNQTNFPAASAGAIANGAAITWPTATADWGTVVAIALFDAATVGNMLAWADLAVNKTVQNGDTLSIAVAALAVSLT